ncbi:MAG: glycosyltransferase family 4 protein [Verrucomicrobiia bacterium]
MKHILILTPTYDPSKDGVAEAAKVTACGLAGRGYRVTVATGYLADRVTQAADANPMVKQFRVSGDSSLRVGIHGDIAAYQEFIANFPGDFIICHGWAMWTTDLAAAVFHKTPAKKVLVSHGFSTHLVNWHRRFPWGLGQWLGWLPYVMRSPFLMRKFSRVVLLSERVDWQRFFDHRVAKLTGYRGIVVIPNGIDPGACDRPLPDFRREFGVGDGCMFLCVANYCTRKNQELAVRAFRKTRVAGAILVFIGSEFNEYQAMVRDLDRELAKSHPEGHVMFIEKINRDMTLAAFNACDIFVLTSKDETQPIVLLETMACGKPFISTESSGCIAELPGGLVVRSEQQISEQMKRLAESPDARQSLGEAGRNGCLARYTHERVVDAYQKLLESLG